MNQGFVANALWTAEDAAAATGGRLLGADSWIATGVSIDTRTLQPGDLFIALQAERDGHEFVADAFAKGAAAALVSEPNAGEGQGPRLIVDDTLEGLRGLARAARARSQAFCVAITGSVGKTSLKEALAAALAPSGETHHAVKSFNNHIGVPLTLARMPPHARFAVFEIGMNHRHEIAPLAALVRPHAAAITWIAPAHIENLGSLAAIADEKADIYSGLVEGGIAIVPADADHADRLIAAAQRHAGRVVLAGRKDGCDSRVVAASPGPDGSDVDLEIFRERITTHVAGPGPHVVHTALLALTATRLAGADLAAAAKALSAHGPVAGRGAAQTIQAPFGAFTLVDDAYNANPASIAAALAALSLRQPGAGGRRIAALGDMLELGDFERSYHAGLAEPIAAHGVDLAFCAGPRMRALWEALPQNKRGGYAEDADSLVPLLTQSLRAGDVVLVKGSNGSRMGRVVAALARLGAGGEG